MPTPIRFKGIVGTTAQIATDRFAGRIAFDSTLNRFVMFYDATNYATMARRDVLETFAAGINDSTLTAGRVMYAGTSGRHQSDAGLLYTTSGGQILTVGDGTSSAARIGVNGAAGQVKGYRLQTTGITRGFFALDASDQTTIQSLDGAGALIDTPVTIPNTAAAAIAFTRTLNTTGNLQTSGTTRISSGGVGTLTTLSTTGAATLASLIVSDLSTTNRILATSTGGQIVTDSGLTRGVTGGSTRALVVGQGTVVDNTFFRARRTATYTAAYQMADEFGTSRWEVVYLADNRLGILARTSGSVDIDYILESGNASGNTITIGGSTNRTVNFTGAIQTSGVTRISSGGAGTLTTLSTTGLATLAQATVSDLTTGRMVSTTTAGRLQALDASGSRSLIGAYGSGDNVSLGAIEKVVSSTTESVSGNIYNQYTTVTQTGIVTNQSLTGTGAGSRTIGAGRLNAAGSGMEIYLCGTYTTDGTAGNATIRVRIGSTTFRTIGSFTLDSNITNGIWYIRGRITTRTTGASGTVGGQIVWEHMGSTVAGAEVMHIQPATSAADVTVDLTASQTIDVDWTATDAGTIITCSCFAIDLIR